MRPLNLRNEFVVLLILSTFFRSVVGLIDGVFLNIIEKLWKVLICLQSDFFRQLLNLVIQTKSGGMGTLHVYHTY